MRVIVFGATGMIGGGVVRECLLDRDVEEVLVVGRAKLGQSHDKLKELILADLTSYEGSSGYDACFFCLGVASSGKSEEEYRRVTYDIAVAAARALADASPAMTFIFVSGGGTDASDRKSTRLNSSHRL